MGNPLCFCCPEHDESCRMPCVPCFPCVPLWPLAPCGSLVVALRPLFPLATEHVRNGIHCLVFCSPYRPRSTCRQNFFCPCACHRVSLVVPVLFPILARRSCLPIPRVLVPLSGFALLFPYSVPWLLSLLSPRSCPDLPLAYLLEVRWMQLPGPVFSAVGVAVVLALMMMMMPPNLVVVLCPVP